MSFKVMQSYLHIHLLLIPGSWTTGTVTDGNGWPGSLCTLRHSWPLLLRNWMDQFKDIQRDPWSAALGQRARRQGSKMFRSSNCSWSIIHPIGASGVTIREEMVGPLQCNQCTQTQSGSYPNYAQIFIGCFHIFP